MNQLVGLFEGEGKSDHTEFKAAILSAWRGFQMDATRAAKQLLRRWHVNRGKQL